MKRFSFADLQLTSNCFLLKKLKSSQPVVNSKLDKYMKSALRLQFSMSNTPKVPSRGQFIISCKNNCPLEGTLGVFIIEGCGHSSLRILKKISG